MDNALATAYELDFRFPVLTEMQGRHGGLPVIPALGKQRQDPWSKPASYTSQMSKLWVQVKDLASTYKVGAHWRAMREDIWHATCACTQAPTYMQACILHTCTPYTYKNIKFQDVITINFKISFYVYACMSVYTCLPGACRSQKRSSAP